MASRRLLAAGLAAVVLVTSGCGSSAEDGSEAEPAATAEVADLDAVDDLRAAFAAADGSPRLLLLLSPT
jgi:outer membrane lipoprotein-sorting protein